MDLSLQLTRLQRNVQYATQKVQIQSKIDRAITHNNKKLKISNYIKNQKSPMQEWVYKKNPIGWNS